MYLVDILAISIVFSLIKKSILNNYPLAKFIAFSIGFIITLLLTIEMKTQSE